MVRLFVHRLDLERLKLLIEDLTQAYDHTFVDLLPQVRTGNLDQRDLEVGILPCMKISVKWSCTWKPTHVHIGAVDGWTPPRCEATVRDLVKT